MRPTPRTDQKIAEALPDMGDDLCRSAHFWRMTEHARKLECEIEELAEHITETIVSVEEFANDSNTDEDHKIGIQGIAEDLKIALPNMIGIQGIAEDLKIALANMKGGRA